MFWYCNVENGNPNEELFTVRTCVRIVESSSVSFFNIFLCSFVLNTGGLPAIHQRGLRVCPFFVRWQFPCCFYLLPTLVWIHAMQVQKYKVPTLVTDSIMIISVLKHHWHRICIVLLWVGLSMDIMIDDYTIWFQIDHLSWPTILVSSYKTDQIIVRCT